MKVYKATAAAMPGGQLAIANTDSQHLLESLFPIDCSSFLIQVSWRRYRQ